MTEIVDCPGCRRALQIPEGFFGKTVECPQCSHLFQAGATAIVANPPAPRADVAEQRDAATQDAPEAITADSPAPKPRKRRRDDDSDLDIALARPRRERDGLPPNRSRTILALGLISLIGGVLFGIPFLVGPVAWYMAFKELRAIADGQLDSKNEGMIRTGRVCGIVATLFLFLTVSCLVRRFI